MSTELEPELRKKYGLDGGVTKRRRKRIQVSGLFLLACFIYVVLCGLVVAYGREAWFDESFSLQTVHLMNEGKEIDWANHDVHPPVYYTVLSWWMKARTTFSFEYFTEIQWARMLSTICGVVFLFYVFLSLRKVFGERVAEMVTFLMAMTVTYIHFGTEIRMYMMLLALSAMILFMILDVIVFFDKKTVPEDPRGIIPKDIQDQIYRFSGQFIVGVLVFLLPFIHYFGTFATIFFVLFIVMVAWKRKGKRNAITGAVVVGIMGMAGAGLSFILYALPQMQRSEAMWFQHSTLVSWPSALSYTFYTPQNSLFGTAYPWMFWAMCLLIVFMLWRAFSIVKEKKEKTVQERVLLMFILTSMFPFLGLVSVPLLSVIAGPGFGNLYHHRLFLVVTWMFGTACYIVFVRWLLKVPKDFPKWTVDYGMKVLSIVMVILLLLSMFSTYLNTSHFELKNTLAYIPCSGVTVAHESPFSGLPAMIYSREKGCNNTNVIISDLTPTQGRTAGYDVLEPEQIYWNLTLPEGKFYYVRSWEGLSVIKDEWVTEMYQDDGVGLVEVSGDR